MIEVETSFIDIKPISINNCFQGRRFRTGDFKDWQLMVISKLPQTKTFSKKLKVVINLYLLHPTQSDIDNYVKAILDCLVKRGNIVDDRYIFKLEVEKERNSVEGFSIEIYDIEGS